MGIVVTRAETLNQEDKEEKVQQFLQDRDFAEIIAKAGGPHVVMFSGCISSQAFADAAEDMDCVSEQLQRVSAMRDSDH
jgi:hypothetical protein